eukprot:Skav202656  [mRNA]  locus=scaffold1791:33520:44717:+ [translate_table: standard]
MLITWVEGDAMLCQAEDKARRPPAPELLFATEERMWALFMQYMLLSLNFGSLLLTLARNSPSLSDAPIVLILGLQQSWQSHRRLRWSKARSAAAQLQAEIWKFRTRVGVPWHPRC